MSGGLENSQSIVVDIKSTWCHSLNMDNANNTNCTPYANLMTGDSIYVPKMGRFFSVAWAGGGTVALETGGEYLWQITGCEGLYFEVARD